MPHLKQLDREQRAKRGVNQRAGVEIASGAADGDTKSPVVTAFGPVKRQAHEFGKGYRATVRDAAANLCFGVHRFRPSTSSGIHQGMGWAGTQDPQLPIRVDKIPK